MEENPLAVGLSQEVAHPWGLWSLSLVWLLLYELSPTPLKEFFLHFYGVYTFVAQMTPIKLFLF